jgi:hypothetical protein
MKAAGEYRPQCALRTTLPIGPSTEENFVEPNYDATKRALPGRT